MSGDNNIDIEKWIRYAQMDFDHALKTTEAYYPVPIEIVCYHCQQSAEKILKAYIIAKEEKLFKKTHDIELLINHCKKYSSEFNNLSETCALLTSYVVTARYPPDIDLTEAEMKQAIKDARQVLEFTKSKLKEMGYEYKPT